MILKYFIEFKVLIIIVSIVIRVVFFIRCIFIIGVIESVIVWGFIK